MRATRYGLPLVEREIQVLKAFANGASYKEIAADLYLAHASVKNYAASAIKKLGARSQAHAVFLACQSGLLDSERRHGDRAGYMAHTRRGEEPCVACRRGNAKYHVRRRAALKSDSVDAA